MSAQLHNLPYVPALDSLRGIAVAAVFAGHAGHYFFSETDNPVPGGFLGVDIFFVLSGYLITGILLRDLQRDGAVDYRRFYVNRFLRLIPALLVLMVVYSLAVLSAGHLQELSAANVLAILFYYFNWYIIQTLDTPEGLGHLWSLSVEEQFYILWPLLLTLLVVRLRSTRWVVAVFLLAIVLVAAVRAQLWHQGTGWLILYIRTDLRADALLTGGLLAFARHRGCLPLIYPRLMGMLAALGLFALALLVAREDAFLYLGGLTLISLLSGLLIITAVEGGPVFYDCWPLRQLGKISYGVYLWHLPVFTALASVEMAPFMQTLLGVMVTLVICMVSWAVVELPCLRRKRHA
jgi:peptidoglycan/LPS O-acetylase OafA/YrhL